ncbi:MAG: tetratricopeptide repeat protein [Acetobacteraceae bacterium]|nr:tetratricopeptide repeat protein [Acetobacteraceae bacterium]
MRIKRASLFFLLGCWAAIPARAQIESREGIALQNQIYELRRDLQILQQQQYRGAPPPSSYLGSPGPRSLAPQPQAGGGNEIVTQLLDRVAALEEQVRRLQGRIDETENRLQRQIQDLAKQVSDLRFQLQGASATAPQAGGPPPVPPSPPPASAAPAPSAPPAPPGPKGPRTPELAIQEARNALARRDYPAAEAAAREVLTNNRVSPRAYDAQFLLAQALAGRKQYAQAAIAYDDAYNRSRTGTHAPDALLGLANSLGSLNEKRAACDTLIKLQAEFPNTLRQQAEAEQQRLNCRQ